jgi:Holliday junction resolvase RusA-like endonuclease
MQLFYTKLKIDKHWSKKNNNRIRKAGNRFFLGKTSELIKATDDLIRYLTLKKALYQTPAIEVPIQAIFKFYFNNFFTKKNQMNLKLGDLSNLIQLPEDSLQKAEIIKDDALIMSYDGSRKLPSSDNFNYLEIEIKEFLD